MPFQGLYLKPLQLFDNQKANVKCLVHRRRAILSDRVGGGKTLSCLFSFAYLKEQGNLSHALVLMPLSAYEKDVWRKDIQKFTKFRCLDLDDLIKKVGSDYSKLPAFLEQYPLILGKHSHCKICPDLIKALVSLPLSLTIVDECHAFKNAKSGLTLAARDCLSRTFSLWGVTGTTISKNMEDLYNIVNFVSPWFFGAFTTFRDYYCLVHEKIIGKGYDGKLKKAVEIAGIKPIREQEFKDKISTLLISGESFFTLHFDWIDYTNSESEKALYRKIAKGINLSPETTSEDWLSLVLQEPESESVPSIKDVERFSSRFIYLQYAADGVLSPDGTFTRVSSTKLDFLVQEISKVVSRGESCLVYFDYLAPLQSAHQALLDARISCKILESTGESVLDGNAVTEAGCKKIPHVILGTKASSESASYYFINHVFFFHIPVTTHTFVQFVGRITRKNSLFPDDLHVHIFRSDNVDLYKMYVVSYKAGQLELVQGPEHNIPDDYKFLCRDPQFKEKQKKVLLWQTRS